MNNPDPSHLANLQSQLTPNQPTYSQITKIQQPVLKSKSGRLIRKMFEKKFHQLLCCCISMNTPTLYLFMVIYDILSSALLIFIICYIAPIHPASKVAFVFVFVSWEVYVISIFVYYLVVKRRRSILKKHLLAERKRKELMKLAKGMGVDMKSGKNSQKASRKGSQKGSKKNSRQNSKKNSEKNILAVPTQTENIEIQSYQPSPNESDIFKKKLKTPNPKDLIIDMTQKKQVTIKTPNEEEKENKEKKPQITPEQQEVLKNPLFKMPLQTYYYTRYLISVADAIGNISLFLEGMRYFIYNERAGASVAAFNLICVTFFPFKLFSLYWSFLTVNEVQKNNKKEKKDEKLRHKPMEPEVFYEDDEDEEEEEEDDY